MTPSPIGVSGSPAKAVLQWSAADTIRMGEARLRDARART